MKIKIIVVDDTHVDQLQKQVAELTATVDALQTLLIPLLTGESIELAEEQMGANRVVQACRTLLERHQERRIADILKERYK